MTWIIDYKEVIIGLICVLCCVLTSFITFYKEPYEKKVQCVREWLLYAVVEAEKEMGSGTGLLKLHYVYNLACSTFEWLPKIVTFETFSGWVDDALEIMRMQLMNNKNAQMYVEGE